MIQALIAPVWRIAAWGIAIGGISFAIGFFGPMILAPGANQGPLLGILITGPLGTLVGLGVGLTREAMGRAAGPGAVFGGLLRGVRSGSDAVRIAAAFGGALLIPYGIAGVRAGEGRGAAAVIVVGAAALAFALTGRVPAWFRR